MSLMIRDDWGRPHLTIGGVWSWEPAAGGLRIQPPDYPAYTNVQGCVRRLKNT
jgi:hypothetical protein